MKLKQCSNVDICFMEEILLLYVSLTHEEITDYGAVIQSICTYMWKEEEEKWTGEHTNSMSRLKWPDTINLQASKLKNINTVLGKEFHKEDGPFVNAREDALASFHVQRQAYHSGTFVGNQIH